MMGVLERGLWRVVAEAERMGTKKRVRWILRMVAGVG